MERKVIDLEYDHLPFDFIECDGFTASILSLGTSGWGCTSEYNRYTKKYTYKFRNKNNNNGQLYVGEMSADKPSVMYLECKCVYECNKRYKPDAWYEFNYTPKEQDIDWHLEQIISIQSKRKKFKIKKNPKEIVSSAIIYLKDYINRSIVNEKQNDTKTKTYYENI